jgi:hypothetical protein
LRRVCTENLVRVDLMRESLNVGHDGRADISLREPGCLVFKFKSPRKSYPGILMMRALLRIEWHRLPA